MKMWAVQQRSSLIRKCAVVVVVVVAAAVVVVALVAVDVVVVANVADIVGTNAPPCKTVQNPIWQEWELCNQPVTTAATSQANESQTNNFKKFADRQKLSFSPKEYTFATRERLVQFC